MKIGEYKFDRWKINGHFYENKFEKFRLRFKIRMNLICKHYYMFPNRFKSESKCVIVKNMIKSSQNSSRIASIIFIGDIFQVLRGAGGDLWGSLCCKIVFYASFDCEKCAFLFVLYETVICFFLEFMRPPEIAAGKYAN